MSAVFSVAIAVVAAIVCAGLIFFIRPSLQRYALSPPTARSSHKIPTPQGGGIAVVAATMAVAYGACFFFTPGGSGVAPSPILRVAVIVMAGIGVTADLRPISVAPRLLLQIFTVAAVIYALPADLRL